MTKNFYTCLFLLFYTSSPSVYCMQIDRDFDNLSELSDSFTDDTEKTVVATYMKNTTKEKSNDKIIAKQDQKITKLQQKINNQDEYAQAIKYLNLSLCCCNGIFLYFVTTTLECKKINKQS